MLIDIHLHTSRKRHDRIQRQEGSQYPTPERVLEMMDEHGIDMAVVLCTVSPECRNTLVIPEETLGICADHPDRFIPCPIFISTWLWFFLIIQSVRSKCFLPTGRCWPISASYFR